MQVPTIGETKRINRHTHIYHACVDCGKLRWVALSKKPHKPQNERCRSCGQKLKYKLHPKPMGHRSYNWRGGRCVNARGYISVHLQPDNFFYAMANKQGYVKEHRLVMATFLKRCLQSWEIVHHRDGQKSHNDISNLQLVTDERHKQITILENKIKSLQDCIRKLEKLFADRDVAAPTATQHDEPESEHAMDEAEVPA